MCVPPLKKNKQKKAFLVCNRLVSAGDSLLNPHVWSVTEKVLAYAFVTVQNPQAWYRHGDKMLRLYIKRKKSPSNL